MSRLSVNLLDLPNEILFYIVKKLGNIDVLYSLFGIKNERLDSIVQQEIFSSILNFTSIVHNATVLDRFCNYILPQIHYNVKCLIVEPASMERILLAVHYPNLTELKLFNFQRDTSLHYFTVDSPLRHIFKQQIKKLDLINKDRQLSVGSFTDYTKRVYTHLLTYFENLEHFKVISAPNFAYPCLLTEYLPATTFSSSILTYLHIDVYNFNDCLNLLDGRLKQLTTFIVQFYFMDTDSPIVHNLDDLPNLKCFSLINFCLIEEYDNKIGSLLRRMLYLENLTLYLCIVSKNIFIDPIYLINEFSMSLPRLQSFKFYLSTENNRNDLVRYLSNNDIKRNYINVGNQELLDIVYFDSGNIAIYHVFTVPFQFTKLMAIGNIFPDIIFTSVIELCLRETVPFEHDVFRRIAKAFPLLKTLYVTNIRPPSHNANKSSDNIMQSYKIVEYPHLTSLDISRVHINYVEEFLNETKTRLPCLTQLKVQYEELRIITEDFTREATRRNCANVKQLITEKHIVGSKDYYIYFPLL